MTLGKLPLLRELITGVELAAIEQHDVTHGTTEDAHGLDAHLERLRAALRDAQEEIAPPLGGSSFAAFSDRLHAAVLAILGTPLVIEGQGCPWTRAGVKLHAELEGIAPALIDAVIDALIEARHAVELPSGGIVVTGE